MKVGTGETTAIALEAIAKAMKHPTHTFTVQDHYINKDPHASATLLANVIRDQLEKLGLQKIHVAPNHKKGTVSICSMWEGREV